MAKQNHPYHLVSPSPWPILSAFASGGLAVGALLFFKNITSLGLWVGLCCVLLCMYGWWRDVVREANTKGIHTLPVQNGLRYGVLFFIASEVMFFAAFFWAYFNARLFPVDGLWPPKGIVPLDALSLPLLNTLILLLSGTTVTWAHHALLNQDRNGFKNGLFCTVILGALFLCLQVYEYSHATFGFRDGIYASTFYMATGFHGFHVLIGTIFLLVCYLRARSGQFTEKNHVGFESAAWYWHFVDVVWLFLFASVYLGG